MRVRILALVGVLVLLAPAVAPSAAPPPVIQVNERGIALMLELAGKPEHKATDFADHIHKVAGPQHIRQLLAATRSENPRVRWTALYGLMGLRLYTPAMIGELYIPLAKRMVSDDDKDVRVAADQLYFNCAGFSEEMMRALVERCKRAIAEKSPRDTVVHLITGLSHAGPKSDAGIAFLDTLIRDPKSDYRSYAFAYAAGPWAVRTFKSTHPLDHCRDFLSKNDDPVMVGTSFQVLATLKPTGKEFGKWIRENAGGPTIGSRQEKTAIQEHAIIAGGRIGGDKEFVALLRKMISDDKLSVGLRLRSVYALGALNHEALPALPELRMLAAKKPSVFLADNYQMWQVAGKIVSKLTTIVEPPARKP